MNTQLIQAMQRIGFTVDQTKKKNITSGRLAGVLTYLDTYKDMPFELRTNKSTATDHLNYSKNEWCGGTLDSLHRELQGDIDMQPFLKARDKFLKNNLAQKLLENYANCQPRRVRVKSEHDGEWDESRRYDIAPYQGVKKSLGGGRCIDIFASASVLCDTSAEQLKAYGCMVWALIDIIESMGVNCRIVFRYYSNHISEDGMDGDTFIEVKKAGEYVSPSLIAAVSQPNFYRRAIFGLRCAMSDCNSERVDGGMGRSVTMPAIEFKKGILTLSPNVNNASFETIEKELLKVMGKEEL